MSLRAFRFAVLSSFVFCTSRALAQNAPAGAPNAPAPAPDSVANVRARIDPDGAVRAGRVVAETSLGFGAACRRTVVGSRWTAPRDKNGSAVATEIVYTCHFEVDQ